MKITTKVWRRRLDVETSQGIHHTIYLADAADVAEDGKVIDVTTRLSEDKENVQMFFKDNLAIYSLIWVEIEIEDTPDKQPELDMFTGAESNFNFR